RPAAPAAPALTTFPQPLVGTVTRARDTLVTGERVAFGRRGLTGTYVWMLPRGAQVTVTGQRAGQYQLRMGAEPVAFTPDSLVTLGGPAPATPPALGPISVRPAAGWVDVVVPADSAAFLVEESGNGVSLTVYGRAPGAGTPKIAAGMITGAVWSAPAPDAARLDLALAQRPWGFQVFYEGAGDLVLRLRRPPAIDPRDPLRGRRIVIDPGHPPVGAVGPTGLTEADANLAVATRVAERLRERGAQVVMTRTGREAPSGSSSQTVDLAFRVAEALQADGELFVALHNNAFPEGINPFTSYGTEAYYFHGQSQELAQALNAEIAAVTRIPNLGAKMSDFAVIRQTWMPAVLTESLFMMFPQQEAALRDPGFIDRLAQAHVRGIESFLRSRAGGR
ncbi:MAG: N-acetylmuramoyl-L-alanine amidase, partial [Gemmatimonadetes bacterium]|nr:N-acetylmuramoyl-L-alanine amidase [Gemmatimonadota bacterium]